MLVHAVHDDHPFHDALRSAVEFEFTELAHWLHLAVSEAPHET
jgi:hypothetical protein